MNIEELKYPVGKFIPVTTPDATQLKDWTKIISDFPYKLESLTKDLTVEQLNWKYRPNGWTIKQVIHHCSDSHINAWSRFKLTLTEDAPRINGYHEDRWAELPDALDNDINHSMILLKGLHAKWSNLIMQLSTEQLDSHFFHAQYNKKYTLMDMCELYAWHCRHHYGHIEQAIKAEGNF